MAIVLTLGAEEHLIGGDFQKAQNQLREWFTLPFLVIFGSVLALVCCAAGNITAKRFRDMSLSE